MPGPALHHMIADRLRVRLQNGTGLGTTVSPTAYADINAQLSVTGNLPYYYLGCQGPDFLFFNTKDMDPALRDLVATYFDVTDFIENFKRELIKLVPQPVLDALAALDEAANEVITSSSTLTELQQLFGDMQNVVNGLSTTLLEAVKRYVSEFALFSIVGHPYRDGVPQPAGPQPAGLWWWFDSMHYRRTGEFAKRLLEKTQPNSPLHLYAVGYLTHVAADTVGHPYVNIISGGPYRSHAQRHKASENYQDVLNFRDVRAQDWNRSQLHAFYNFNFTGTIDTENDIPDPFTQLPDELARLITETLAEVYNEDPAAPSPDYGRPMTLADVNDAYRIWYRWFRNSTDTGTLPLPVPYSFTRELREVWDQAMENLDDIGDFIEDAANRAGSMGILGIFLLLGALILAALAAAAALIDAVLGALTTIGSATIRYAACLIYEQIYAAYENFRLAVAMNGLAFPLLEHLSEPRIVHWGNPSLPDSSNVTTGLTIRPSMPINRNASAGLFHDGAHLDYPVASGEPPFPTFAVPESYLDKTSTWYAWGDIPQDVGIFRDLEDLHAAATGVPDADRLKAIYNDRRLLGNALDLSRALYERAAAGQWLPDFNLDGDRAYGDLCWNQPGDPAPDFPNPLPPLPVQGGPAQQPIDQTIIR